jgi:hypothetical protein
VHRQAGREVAPALRRCRRPCRRAPEGGPLWRTSLRRGDWTSARRRRPGRPRGRALLPVHRPRGARAPRRRVLQAGLRAPAEGRRRRGPPRRSPLEVRLSPLSLFLSSGSVQTTRDWKSGNFLRVVARKHDFGQFLIKAAKNMILERKKNDVRARSKSKTDERSSSSQLLEEFDVCFPGWKLGICTVLMWR